MESKLASILVYTALSVSTMAIFPLLCWIEVLTLLPIALYRHVCKGRAPASSESMLMTGVLFVLAVMAVMFIPTLQYFLLAVAILMFFLAKESFISASVSIAIWIFAYISFEMTLFSFVGVLIFTFLKSTGRSSRRDESVSPKKERGTYRNNISNTKEIDVGPRLCQPEDNSGMDGRHCNSHLYPGNVDRSGNESDEASEQSSVAVTEDSINSTASDVFPINPEDSSSMSVEGSGIESDGTSVHSPVAGTEENINSGMSNVSPVIVGEASGRIDTLSGTFSPGSGGIVADTVTDSNVAHTVYGGMGNTTDIKDSSISSVNGNASCSTTPESRFSGPTESVEVAGGHVSNVAGIVHGGVGHETNIKKSSISTELQNSDINSPLFAGITNTGDGSVEGGGTNININMNNVRTEEGHSQTIYSRKKPDASDRDNGDAEPLHSEDEVQDEDEEFRKQEKNTHKQRTQRTTSDTSTDDDHESTVSVDKYTLKNVHDKVTELSGNLLKTKPQDTSPLESNPSSQQEFDATQVQRDIEAKEKLERYGRTPLMMAARAGDKTLFFKLKDQTDCDLTKQDRKSNNILHIACLGGNTDIVAYLLGKRLDVNRGGQYGRTPVMLAAQKGHYGVFKVLVEYGCHLVAEDANGNTILHMACIGGKVEIVKLLIEQGIYKINTRGQYGRTPVMLAVDKGNEEVFSYLLEHQCDLTILDDDGVECSVYAKRGGNTNIMRRLRSVMSE